MKIKILFASSIILLGIFLSSSFALAEYKYKPMEKIPGTYETLTETSDAPSYLVALYNFGIWGVGISALLMITIGGFWYMTSAGNNSRMETAKNMIWDALLGLIMAMATYLLLFVINPDLVKINILMDSVSLKGISSPPKSPTAPVTPPATSGGACDYSKVPSGLTASCCGGGISCADCSSCVKVTKPCKTSNCYLSSSFNNKLNNVNYGGSWRVTEPWPPTYTHKSSCHKNGTCADINLNGSTDPTEVKKLQDSLTAAGFSSFTYESTSSCANYTAKGVKCTVNTAASGNHFHVNN